MEEFIPYLVLVRFDKDEDLKDRLQESLPLLRDALAELGPIEPVLSAYDGSAVAYLLEAGPDIQPRRILSQLESPSSRRPSPTKHGDRVLVIAVECGVAARMERITDWLREHECLSLR